MDDALFSDPIWMHVFVICLNDSMSWSVCLSGWNRCRTDFLAYKAKKELA